MKPLTVKELMMLCSKQVQKGNGDKVIMISNDDEGNGYHYLWYAFQTVKEMEKPFEYNGRMITPDPIEDVCEDIAKKEDTIILG